MTAEKQWLEMERRFVLLRRTVWQFLMWPKQRRPEAVKQMENALTIAASPLTSNDVEKVISRDAQALKWCPFCGGDCYVTTEASAHLATGEYYQGDWMECEGCGVQGPRAVWNRRTYRK